MDPYAEKVIAHGKEYLFPTVVLLQ